MIRTENLFFSYNGSAPYVLDNISLYIKDGEYVSILGENGSGKSTLIKLMLKLLKPARGTIECDTHRIGYVPQKNDFSNAQFPITVYEMLNSYRKLLKIKDKNAISESLDRVRMTEYKDALVGTLSGGQSQKIFIARALIGNPRLLILDEPSTGVDVNSQKEIYGFIKKVNAENGITIVSVEHNLDAAMKNSTLIYHLAAGHGHLCTPEKYISEFLNSGDGDETGA
jgi:zinc transport system ATP-binding protein